MSLAVCARDVRFYQWPEIQFLGIYEVPSDRLSVKNITWSADGTNLLVVKSKECPILISTPLKSQTKLTTRRFSSISNADSGAFSKISPNLIALGMENGEIVVSDIDYQNFNRYQKLPSGIQNLDFSMDNQNLVAGCIDGNIFLFNTLNGKVTASFEVPNSCGTLNSTKFSCYEKLLAAVTKDGVLAVWKYENADLEFSSQENPAKITDLAFLENTITTVGTDGHLCIFDLRTHELVTKSNLDGALSGLAYFNETYDLAISTYNQIRAYDIRNLKTPQKTLLINSGGHIRNIAAFTQKRDNLSSIREQFQSSILFTENDESIEGFPFFETNHHNNNNNNNNNGKTYNRTEVDDIQKFVDDYMKYKTDELSRKIAEKFSALQINLSKQFIAMEEKMEENWNNFVFYLRVAGESQSRKGSKISDKNNNNNINNNNTTNATTEGDDDNTENTSNKNSNDVKQKSDII